MKSVASAIWKIVKVIFGLGCIVGGILLVISDTSRFVATEAEVVSVSDYYEGDNSYPSYDVDYSYQVDGSTYTGSLTDRTQRWVGDKITVYYDPKAPSESWTTRNQKRFAGIVFIALGLWPVVDQGLKWWKNRKAWLKVAEGIAGER